MYARSVVITEMTTRNIIRTLHKESPSRCIDAVDIPCKGFTESLFSRHRIEGNALIITLPTRFINMNATI